MAITSAKAITSATKNKCVCYNKAITSAYMYGNTTNHILKIKIVNENIFQYTFCVYKNCWENIFFRPEEAMFENWQKLVSSYKY